MLGVASLKELTDSRDAKPIGAPPAKVGQGPQLFCGLPKCLRGPDKYTFRVLRTGRR